MCKDAVKKLPFVIGHVPGQYKTKEMCEKAILKIGRIVESVSDLYKNN